MVELKCKMCGGNLKIIDKISYATCEYCGSTMTLPNLNDDRIVNLFNRANQYRLQNEFDKAMATYENILAEDNSNAEAHWGVILAKYGIEYVEDPNTHNRVPTCHRVQYESILSDLDYKEAIKNAQDNKAKTLYEKEATQIAEIQNKNLIDSLKMCNVDSVRQTIFDEIQKMDEERKEIEKELLLEGMQKIDITVPEIKFFLREMRKRKN